MILKYYINNFGSASWKCINELNVKYSKNRIEWGDKHPDVFIKNSANDKTLLAEDILANGMYWGFFTIDDFVLFGHHRIQSLKLLNGKIDNKFLCIELNKNHINEYLKYDNVAKLPAPIHLGVPKNFKAPSEGRLLDYGVLKNSHYDKCDKLVNYEVNTYRELIDMIMIIPHWIRNDLFIHNIKPSDLINSQTEFEKWIKE